MIDAKSLEAFQATLKAMDKEMLFDPAIPAIVWLPESGNRIKAERIYMLGERLQAYARRLIGSGAIAGMANGGEDADPPTRSERPAPAPEPEMDPDGEPDEAPAEMVDHRDVTLAEDGFPHPVSEARQFLDQRRGKGTSAQALVPKSVGRNIIGAPSTMPAPLDRPEAGDDSRRRVERFPPSQRARTVDPRGLAPIPAERRRG